jgi:ATP-binding cassette subfamily F protein 3
VIRTTDLTLRRGPRVLLDRASFVVHPGERVGVVGRNGCGKSSLFALIRGLIDADAGRIDLPETWRLSWVEQEIPDRHKPAREHVIDGDQQLRALETKRKALDTLEHHTGNADEIGHRIAEAEAALIDADAWSAPARAEQLLAGLGFTPEQWLQPVGTFSGGWQMRINLARALMAPSDLLLLDEPTNHLDLDAMLWLERWLDTYTGTVLLISHDTEFLDAVARTILHIDQLQGRL